MMNTAKTLKNSLGEPHEVVNVNPVALPEILKSGTKLAEALKDAGLFLTPDGQLVSLSQERPACPAVQQVQGWDRLLKNP